MVEDKIIKTPPFKRIFDVIISGLVLIIFSPLLLVIFLLAKLESLFNPEARGKFFYQEVRMSQDRPFNFYKIRIFKTKVLKEVLGREGFIHTKPLEREESNLTRTGYLVKKFYLDELPQFWCVLTGQMSIVGPRPWNPVDYENDVKAGNFRKKVLKAGLTGLVQISKGRNGDHKNGTDLDEKYIELVKNLSPLKLLLLDLWIMGRSIRLILRGEGL